MRTFRSEDRLEVTSKNYQSVDSFMQCNSLGVEQESKSFQIPRAEDWDDAEQFFGFSDIFGKEKFS